MWPGDDFNDRLHLIHLVQGFELELSNQFGQNGFLLHQSKFLTNAVARTGREWNVSVGMARHTGIK